MEEWRENFGMSEALFYMLCEELRPYYKDHNKTILHLSKQATKLRNPVSVETQVAVTLYYLADEGRMTSVISEKLGSKYKVLPKTKEEVKEHARNFYNRYGFPQCIGAVVGTHIKIKRPVDNSADYMSTGEVILN